MIGGRAGSGSSVRRGGGGRSGGSGGKKLPDDHRFTSLEHTLIDVLIAAHSRHFKPGEGAESYEHIAHILLL